MHEKKQESTNIKVSYQNHLKETEQTLYMNFLKLKLMKLFESKAL